MSARPRAGGEFIGVRETARRLGVHENTVRNWAYLGHLADETLPVPGAPLRFRASAVDDLAMRRAARAAELGRTVPRDVLRIEVRAILNEWRAGRTIEGGFVELLGEFATVLDRLATAYGAAYDDAPPSPPSVADLMPEGDR